jgi:hypothetical protein
MVLGTSLDLIMKRLVAAQIEKESLVVMMKLSQTSRNDFRSRTSTIHYFGRSMITYLISKSGMKKLWKRLRGSMEKGWFRDMI